MRAAGDARALITSAYLAGMLTHCDPEKAPSLDEILGESEAETDNDNQVSDEGEDPRANVRAWMAALGGAKPVQSEEGEANA